MNALVVGGADAPFVARARLRMDICTVMPRLLEEGEQGSQLWRVPIQTDLHKSARLLIENALSFACKFSAITACRVQRSAVWLPRW